MNILDMLEDVMAGAVDDWSDEDRDLAADVASDLSVLMLKEIAGQNVGDELAIAKASAQSIAAGAALTGVAAINQAIERVLAGVAAKLTL